MRILELIRKDLSQIVRDWKSFVFLLAMPIVFTLFFGILFGNAGAGQPIGGGFRQPGSAGRPLFGATPMGRRDGCRPSCRTAG